ncbi:hypothetical protein [Brevibacillus dissolubilis]|uniref:hypothetical protein n=1 Tax=Brevibacillus dissolubilis TaxID=1844116 RepID=UPI0011174107|nr:hypothetical protein [Brevibacillus dissolubilis]
MNSVVRVQSYFLKPDAVMHDQGDVVQHPERYVIGLHEREAIGAKIDKTHPVYPGTIVITDGYGQSALGYRYWDSLDMYWANLVGIMETLCGVGHTPVEATFTYQPAGFGLKVWGTESESESENTSANAKEQLVLYVKGGDGQIQAEWSFPKRECLLALTEGASAFFHLMKELGFGLFEGEYEEWERRIERIREAVLQEGC